MSEHKPVLVTPKPFWESRTVWVNTILMLAGLLAYVLRGIQMGEISSPFEVDAVTLSFWIGVLNLILRSLTTQPVTRGREDTDES